MPRDTVIRQGCKCLCLKFAVLSSPSDSPIQPRTCVGSPEKPHCVWGDRWFRVECFYFYVRLIFKVSLSLLTVAFSWPWDPASSLPHLFSPLPPLTWYQLHEPVCASFGERWWRKFGNEELVCALFLPTRLSSYFWIWLFCRSLAVGSKSGYKFFSLSSVDKLEQIYECSKCLLYFSPFLK